MAHPKFIDMVKEMGTELENNPLMMDAAKAQCNNQKTIQEMFSFIWNLKEAQEILTTTLITSEKSQKKADMLRKSGNKHFQEKNYELALRDYNLSIINAPHPILRGSRNETKTERQDFPYIDPANYGGIEGECKMLAVGFANRSAVLFEMEMYEECLNDINMAFEYGYPEAFRATLDQRKEQCLNFIHNMKDMDSNNSNELQLHTDGTEISTESPFNTGVSDNAGEIPLYMGATRNSEDTAIDLDATDKLGESHIGNSATYNSGEYPLDANARENTSKSLLYIGAIDNSSESANDSSPTGNSGTCALNLSGTDNSELFSLDVGTTNYTEVPMDTSSRVSSHESPHEITVIGSSFDWPLNASATYNPEESSLHVSAAADYGESLLCAIYNSDELPPVSSALENFGDSYIVARTADDSIDSPIDAGDTKKHRELLIDAGNTNNSGELPLHEGTTENFSESILGVGVLDKSGQSHLCTDATDAEKLSNMESESVENYFLSLNQPSPPPSETSSVGQVSSNKKKAKNKKPQSLTIPPFTDSLKHGFHPSKGSCFIASRDIKPGELLGAEEAFSVNIDVPEFQLYCSTCVKKCVNPLPCPSCTQVVFCSESCRTKGLSEYHWLECKILPTLLSLDIAPRNLAIKMLRTLSYPKLNALINNFKKETTNPAGDLDSCSDGVYVANSYRSIHNLFTNKDKYCFGILFYQCMVSFIFTKLLCQSGRFFVDKNGNPVSPTQKAIIRTGATLLSHSIKLNCNPLRISDRNEEKSIASGIFPLLSQLNHSCYPNARHFSCGRTLMLRTIRPITAGEEVTICYSHEFHNSSLEERKEFLEKYNFTCTCEACQNKWPTFDFLPIITYKCPECKMPLPGPLQICSDCLGKAMPLKAKLKMHMRKDKIEEIVSTIVLNTYDLQAKINNGASEEDFQAVCEHIELMVNHIHMPCQNVLMSQNLLFKCFDDGF